MKRSNISIQVHKKKYLDVLLFYCVCGTLANMAKYRRENYRPHWTGTSLQPRPMRKSFQMQVSLHCELVPVQYLEIQFIIEHEI